MAIATFAELEEKFLNPREFTVSRVAVSTSVQGRMHSTWTMPVAGAVPTTAVVPTNATVGSLGQQNGTNLRIPGFRYAGNLDGMAILCDRLSHQGGLSGVVTGAQTTNLPTAALTRYTSGVGVMCFLEIYTIIGTTATTVTVSYTDQDGNTGQTSPAIAFGGTNFREAIRAISVPCASDDTGFRAVASVTLAATTGTAGNFGVTLVKPLLAVPVRSMGAAAGSPVLGGYGGGLPVIENDACLFWMFIAGASGTSSAASTLVTTAFSED